jgi:hypothetical protein
VFERRLAAPLPPSHSPSFPTTVLIIAGGTRGQPLGHMRGRSERSLGADELMDLEARQAKFRPTRSERPMLAPLAEGVVAVIPSGCVVVPASRPPPSTTRPVSSVRAATTRPSVPATV